MSELFHFSPRLNRAAEIDWAAWGADAFERASATDRPILLHLTTVWCRWCHLMDETTFSDSDVIELINREMVPIRVDADRDPHVRDRYIAGGWPTTAFLTPSGEMLWAGTGLEAADFTRAARSVLDAWAERREELRADVEQRRRALEAAAGHRSTAAIVRRESGDDVVALLQESFDGRNGGFGDAPKFPPAEAVRLLYCEGQRLRQPDWIEMARRTLDGMLAGELFDNVGGGFFRYALAPDWTQPQYEKLLSENAALVRAYALGAAIEARADWADVVSRTVDWARTSLDRGDGLWASSQDADAEYYALDAQARTERDAPFVDRRAFTDANAAWAGALADAGGRMGRPDWIELAVRTGEALFEAVIDGSGPPAHAAGRDGISGLLADAVALVDASLQLAQATGAALWIERARALAGDMRDRLLADDGGFYDRSPNGDDIGALRYRDRPFEDNARAARLLLDLARVGGDRGHRAVAERTLATLSPRATRFGVAAAPFALAVAEFFDPPVELVITGELAAAAPLRAAALALPRADRRVWSLPEGGRIGQRMVSATPAPAVHVCGARSCSDPVTDPEALADAAARIT